MEKNDYIQKVKNFYAMHQAPNILVLPNSWDATSARLFEQGGFRAIGTTSAGIAASLGYAEPEKIPLHEMLAAIKRIIRAVQIPVSADMEAGYASTNDGVAETIKKIMDLGAVGVNLEDSTGLSGSPLQDINLQAQRIKVARQIAESKNIPFVINARTDLYLFNVGDPNSRFNEAISRANAYLDSGATCVFIPGVTDSTTIANLVDKIHGPINILANPGVPSVSELQKLGVARVSVGSGPMRATLGLIRKMANELLTSGTYESFTTESIPYPEVNSFFQPCQNA